MISHYNTTHESGATLRAYENAAKSLEKRIYEHMIVNSDVPRFSPTKLHEVFNNVPITSIRRALTNLTKEGKCYKSDLMSNGSYGRPEHNWGLLKKI